MHGNLLMDIEKYPELGQLEFLEWVKCVLQNRTQPSCAANYKSLIYCLVQQLHSHIGLARALRQKGPDHEQKLTRIHQRPDLATFDSFLVPSFKFGLCKCQLCSILECFCGVLNTCLQEMERLRVSWRIQPPLHLLVKFWLKKPHLNLSSPSHLASTSCYLCSSVIKLCCLQQQESMYPKEQVIAIPEPVAERIMKGRQGKELPSAGQIKVWLTGNMN